MTGKPKQIAGITMPSVSGAQVTRANSVFDALAAATGRRITVRVVIDEPPAVLGDYTAPIASLSQHADVMVEIIDSFYMPIMTTVQQFKDRTTTLLNNLGDTAKIYEVGNEVVGRWTWNPDAGDGPKTSYAFKASQYAAAFDLVKAAGKKAALTLWYNPNCIDSGMGEISTLAWIQNSTYITPAMAAGMDYVFLSWYPSGCVKPYQTNVPNLAAVQSIVDAIHAKFPKALVGWGELGLAARTPVDPSDPLNARAKQIMRDWYGLPVARDWWVTGGFWWYGNQDVIDVGAPLYSNFQTAIDAMPTP